MSVKIVRGDLFESRAEALINPVNCVGVSGKGLAAEFKRRFPDNQRIYVAACKAGALEPGKVLTTIRRHRQNILEYDTYIFNVPTKRHWRNQSRLDDVLRSTEALADQMFTLRVGSAAVPALGCGYGGLDWAIVKPLLIKIFNERCPAATVELYEPY